MGWTVYSRWTSPEDRAAERAEVIRLYTAITAEAPYTAECLMASRVGATWYMAVRLAPKPGRRIPERWLAEYARAADGSITYAAVVLTSRQGGEWGYKDLSEGLGPYEAKAPLKLLALLSPLIPDNDRFAADWRERVRAHHAAKRERVKIAPGDRFEVGTSFRFGGGPGGDFEARRFEAFLSRRPGRRARTLYRTLDTDAVHVVRLPLEALHAARPRLLRPPVPAG